MKKIHILLLIFSINTLYAQGGAGNCGSVSGVIPGGTSTDWLYKGLPTIIEHLHEVDSFQGDNCKRNIQVTTTSNTAAKAYYIKDHDDSSEVRFRFLLNTEDLLESLVTGDKVIFYSFSYFDVLNNSHQLLKVRLIKSQAYFDGTVDWDLKFQWFDTVNGGSDYQTYTFNDASDFIEFEFLWKKSELADATDLPLYETTQASVMIKEGDGINDRPVYLQSPFTYDAGNHALVSSLKGQSNLGIINTASNTLQFGDEMRIFSLDLYD